MRDEIKPAPRFQCRHCGATYSADTATKTAYQTAKDCCGDYGDPDINGYTVPGCDFIFDSHHQAWEWIELHED